MKTKLILISATAILLSSCSKLNHIMRDPNVGKPYQNATMIHRNPRTGAVEMVANTDANGNIKITDYTGAKTGEWMGMSVNNHFIQNMGTYYKVTLSDGSVHFMSIKAGNDFIKKNRGKQ